MPRVLPVIVAAALGALGCQAVVAPDAAPARDASPVRTDTTVYRLRRTNGAYETTATATYVNRTGASVYYARCGVGGYDGPLFGVRRTGPDSTRILFSEIAWGCVGGVPTGTLAPGDSVTVHVRLGASDQPRMTPPLRPEDIVGLLRVELALCVRFSRDSDACERLPQAARQSNAFDVRY